MLDKRDMQYIYQDGDGYVFLDVANDELCILCGQEIGAQMRYLKEGCTTRVMCRDGKPIAVHLPSQVELEVVEAEACGGGATQYRSATLETGLKIRVPAHVDAGDILRIDTRSGDYLGLARSLASDIKGRIG